MDSELRPYPAYKNSSVPWLGEVPEHWEARRLRNTAEMRVSNVDKHTKVDELPVRLCNYVDVYKHDRINHQISFMRATASQEEIARFRLECGDVLITKDSEAWNDIGVPALVEQAAEDLICGYHLALLRPLRDRILGEYLFRVLQSTAIAYQFHVEANGVTRYGLSHAAIKAISLPIPPLPEQAAIVRFLNHADRRIRRYIRVKLKLIKLLEEQKQAIIHRAVTRGLNPDVRLKSSGIAWLGDIPEHWKVLRSKYIFREIDERSPMGEETRLSMSQKFGLIPSSQIEERRLFSESYAGAKICECGDLVLNRLKAHLGVFALAFERGLVSPDYTVFRPAREMESRYFELVYRTPACRLELRQRAKGIVEGFWRLYTDDFYDIRVPVPPVPEQKRLVAALDDELATTKRTINRAEREIALIREYWTRLLADVVTGQHDVRAVAAKLPQEPEGFETLEDSDVLVESEQVLNESGVDIEALEDHV
jgi:type I restriction enzyme S subunit